MCVRERGAPGACTCLTAYFRSGHIASSLATPCPWPELWEKETSLEGQGAMCYFSRSPGDHVALASHSTCLWLCLPPSSPSCPTCLQGLQRANRCGRAFEVSMPYKFKVFGNGFLINLPTLSSWKRQKSQIHSRFNLPWCFLSRWLKSFLSGALCTSP